MTGKPRSSTRSPAPERFTTPTSGVLELRISRSVDVLIGARAGGQVIPETFGHVVIRPIPDRDIASCYGRGGDVVNNCVFFVVSKEADVCAGFADEIRSGDRDRVDRQAVRRSVCRIDDLILAAAEELRRTNRLIKRDRRGAGRSRRNG